MYNRDKLPMRIRLVAVTATLFAIVRILSAEDPPLPASPEDSTHAHEEIVVSATRSERSAADVPASVSVVTKEQIATTPVHTTDELLRAVPGLNLPATSSNVFYPTSNTVSMRGLGGNRALVLLDGVPMNDPFSGYIPWQRVPPQTIERVEVVRGGAASLFGNYAMGGVVNILTSPADRERLSADSSFGSYGTDQVSASYSHLFSDSTGLGIDANTFDSDGYFRTPKSQRGAIDTPFWSRARVFGMRFDHSSDSGLSTFGRASYSRSVLSNGTQLSGDDRNALDFSGGLRSLDVLGGDVALSAFGERQEFDNQNTSLANGSRDAEFLSNRHQTPIRSLGGSLQWTRHVSTSLPLIIFGLDVDRLQAEDRGEFFDSSGALTRRRNSGGRQDFGGLFAEVDLFPVPRFEVLASARLDVWRNFDGKETVHPGSSVEYNANQTTQLDPRLALRYDLGRGFAVRGAVYRAFRAPTLNDLYRSSQSKTFQNIGNPNLGPETLLGSEVGAEVSGGSGSAQLNVFTNTVRDLISPVPISTTPQLILQNVNVGQSRSRGVELFGRFAISRSLSIDAAATYTRSIVTDNPPDRSLEGKLVPLVPERFASLGVQYAASGGWVATLRARSQSLRYQDASNEIRLDPVALVDFYVAYSLGLGFELNGWVENLFDRRYVSDALLGARFGAPRQFFGGIRFQPDLTGPRRTEKRD
jgi:outer membrane receptor protein involved in Fe transport